MRTANVPQRFYPKNGDVSFQFLLTQGTSPVLLIVFNMEMSLKLHHLKVIALHAINPSWLCVRTTLSEPLCTLALYTKAHTFRGDSLL